MSMHRFFHNLVGKSKVLVSISVTVVFILIAGPMNLLASSDAGTPEFNQDILTAVAKLYGISDDQAIDRLARESEAAIALKQLQDLSIKSYAGSWFDESSLRLKVALADPNDVVHLKPFDVDPVIVRYSLTEMREKLDKAKNHLSLEPSLKSTRVTSYINYKTNTVMLGVEGIHTQSVRYALADSEFSESIQIEESDGLPTLSTGPVRGGDGTRNMTWQPTPNDTIAPCSVGASVEDGFVTASHCGFLGNSIGDSNHNPLGTTQGSAFDWFNPFIDAGYVETITGWTPAPQVNGYTNGVFPVSAEWAGMIEYPVGSTVCRYGQTSGGPHCGTVNQLNLDQVFQLATNVYQIILDVTRVAGSCTDDGDSGGTWVGGTGQVQGVNIGGTPVNTCPTQTTWTYYQPIKDVVDEFGVTMLTTHGSTAPQINQVKCPDMANSGSGSYHCLVTGIDSQGEIQLQWSTSTGSSSTSPSIFGTCSNWDMVSVTLQASNPYGTSSKNYTFLCPGGPIP